MNQITNTLSPEEQIKQLTEQNSILRSRLKEQLNPQPPEPNSVAATVPTNESSAAPKLEHNTIFQRPSAAMSYVAPSEADKQRALRVFCSGDSREASRLIREDRPEYLRLRQLCVDLGRL